MSIRKKAVADPLKLRGKLTVLLLVLSLIPLSAISTITYRQGEQRVRENITGHLRSIVEKDAGLINSFLAERLADLKVLSSEAALPGGITDKKNLDGIMHAMRKEYKVYRRIAIVAINGAVVAAVGRGTDQYENMDKVFAMEWFREASSGRDFISDVFLSGSDNTPLLIISTAIKDGDGSIHGVAVARIDFSSINSIMREMELGKTGEAYLIDKKGYFLTRSRLGGRILEDRIPSDQEPIYLGESGVSEHVDYRGKKVLSALQWVPNRDWVLVAKQDSDEAFEQVRSFKAISLGVGAGVAFLVIVVAFIVSGKIEGYLKRSYDEVVSLKKYSEDTIDSMPLSVLVLSRDLKIMQVNRDFHERFGIDERKIKGKALMDIVPDRKLEEKVREVLDRSLPLDAYEIEHDFGKGGKRTLNVRAVPAHLGGSTHILLIIVDVTEKKALEEQMQHAEKLSSLGTLTAGVAHELNTPLANILLSTQMLIEESREGGKPDIETLGIIENQAKQGSSIVRGLLEFSRQSELTSEVADVNEILDNLLEITESQLRLSKIRLVKTFDRDIPRIKTDIGKLQQVFMNIISNAVWAMPDGGELAVRTGMDGTAGKVSVELSDTGCGIPAQNMGKIFDPFFTTKENGQGTGLGLAVSYGIIKEMSGKIDVKSVQAGRSPANGSGTTFLVSLPVPDGINGS